MSQPIPSKKSSAKDDEPPALWVLLIFTAVGLGVPGGSLCSMADDLLLHSQGVLAKDGSCDLVVHHSSRYGDSTTMIVDYTAADGSKHFDTAQLPFILWPRDPDKSVPCEVRYKATAPDRYSTTWGFDRLPSRFIGFLFLQTWLLFIGLFSLWGTGELLWGRLRRLFRKRAAA